jgi:hypothetical protein
MQSRFQIWGSLTRVCREDRVGKVDKISGFEECSEAPTDLVNLLGVTACSSQLDWVAERWRRCHLLCSHRCTLRCKRSIHGLRDIFVFETGNKEIKIIDIFYLIYEKVQIV